VRAMVQRLVTSCPVRPQLAPADAGRLMMMQSLPPEGAPSTAGAVQAAVAAAASRCSARSGLLLSSAELLQLLWSLWLWWLCALEWLRS
jgi:hypothetical protein